MGRGSKIYHRFGLKWALAYRCKKLKRKIKNNTPLCLQKALMFFRILKLKNTNKFQIYTMLTQCHCIIEKQKHLEFIAKHYEEIHSWLNSQEFKEKYVKTNHPYPPLLNPERLNAKVESCNDNKLSALSLQGTNKVRDEAIHNVAYFKDSIVESKMDKNMDCHDSTNAESRNDEHQSKSAESIQPYPNLSYESISPELAWDLNLPLPQSDMVKFESHGVGGIFLSFLNRIGIPSVLQKDLDYDCRKIYTLFFYALNNGAKIISMWNYLTIKAKDGKKLHSLIQKPKILALNQVRDPIGMLKHYVAYKRRSKFAIHQFDITQDPKAIVSTLVRYGKGELAPNANIIPHLLDKILKGDGSYICFHDGQLFEELINIRENEVEFMDMSEIIGEKTLQTMSKFATIFNLPEPKQEDREFFLTKNSDFGEMLPLILCVDCNHTKLQEKEKRIKIYIVSKLGIGDRKDITLEMLNFVPKGIFVVIAQEDWDALRVNAELCEQTKNYLQELIKELVKQHKIEMEKKFTEEDVLRFMKANKLAREKFKRVLDKHLFLIKQMRPDIVESWKYYQEFERMCKELD